MRIRHKELLLALALSALPLASFSASEGVPVARGEKIRDFARITFEWPRSTYLEAQTHGRTLTVTFDRSARPDLSALTRELSPYIESAEEAPDGHTLRFRLNGDYRVRSFVSGTINGVDILHVQGKPEPHARKRERTARALPPAPKALVAAALPPKPESLLLKPLPQDEAALAALAPAAGNADSAPTPATPAPVDDTKVLRIFATPTVDGTLLRFPWKTRVAAAVFSHGGHLWVVFNKPIALDLDAVKETAPQLYPMMSASIDGQATVLRIANAADNAVDRPGNGFEWQVILGVPTPPHERLRVDTSTAPPLPPYVFIPASELAEPLRLKDPDLSGKLIAVPSYQPGRGIFPARKFVDFALAETAQGVAVQAVADDTVVEPVMGGVRVTTARGAIVSPNLPPPSAETAKNDKKAASSTLFPYAEWHGSDAMPFMEKVKELQRNIASSANAAAANPLRLKLAELYLSEGMAPEAIGMLQEIRRVDPQFFIGNHLSALLGAADFLMFRFADAAQDFAAPELTPLPEIHYWRAMMAELLGTPGQHFDYLANEEAYIRNYPPKFQQRLAIVAADRAVGMADYGSAVKILDTLKRDDALAAGVSDYITFITAKIAASTGKLPEAVEAWMSLAQTANPVVAARAQFALISQQLKSHLLTPDQAIDQLERLRMKWRGDALELEVLTVLGDMYQQRKDYVNALGIWRDITAAFPNTPQAAEVLPKMSAVFVELFDHGAADNLPPLTQLALYYDYKDLTPSDTSGDRIIDGLANRLVAMDLLDQASALLEQRVRFSYEKAARSRAGAKLARIYITSRQPERALSALQASMYGDNTEALRTERDYLAARAMMELGQFQNALVLISNDVVPEADDIRLETYWKQKDWADVISTIEASLKNRTVPTAPVTPREADRLIQLALAYTMTHEQDQLRYLHDYFGPLMAENPRKALFDFITRPDVPVTPDRFADLLKDFDDTRSFLKNYRVVPPLEVAGDEAPAPEAAAPSAPSAPVAPGR